MQSLRAFVDRHPRLLVTAVLLLALSLRLGWALTRPTDDAAIDRLPDQREYLDLGRSLLRDGTLAMGDARFNDVVSAFRMPGYPALIAACGGSVKIVLGVQAVIDASTVLATILIARRWLSPGVSALAGLAVALDPLHVYFSGLVLSETSSVALLTWGMACLVCGRSPVSSAAFRSHLLWALGIALLIAAIYFRPSLLVFPLVLAFVAAIAETQSPEFVPATRRVPMLAIVALATLLALLPWALRNRALLGRTIFTTTNDGFTFYDGLNPDADGSSNQAWVDEMPLLQNLNEVQRSDYLRDKAIAFARERPLHVMAMVPTKLARVWSPWPLSGEYGTRRNVILEACHAVPLFLLALVGLFNKALRRSTRLFFLVPAILISVMQGVTVGSLRYRMPVEPTLAILAAAAFHRPERTRDDVAL